MGKQIVLRDYQVEMLERLRREWAEHRSVMVQMPTGTGKTAVLAEAVREELCADEKGEVWIVAHRKELVSQIGETILKMKNEEFLPEQASLRAERRMKNRVRVYSIQWLGMNWERVREARPSMIVIDEAHHALARTYRELWKRYPEAKKLGMTATPYRMDGRGFTELFEVLLQSDSVERFIEKGVLSRFECLSIGVENEMQRLIGGLKKRGADGDYQTREMERVLNRQANIEQLHRELTRYAAGKKGIVYAISIAHAREIARYYTEQGIRAVAIDSRTAAKVRKEDIEAFRRGEVDVLVNVDVFSEGFDCPDVEFVQLARPTLSLAKYLQQVGRGLRKAKGKRNCILIDSVGLCRTFGPPTRDWDWQAMFEGRMSFCGDDIAAVTDVEGKQYYIDLKNNRRYKHRPLVIRYPAGVELLQIDGIYYSRTKQKYDNRSRISNFAPIWRGWYLKMVDVFPPKGIGYTWTCVIAGDEEQVYWLCREQEDGSIVVMNRQGGVKKMKNEEYGEIKK